MPYLLLMAAPPDANGLPEYQCHNADGPPLMPTPHPDADTIMPMAALMLMPFPMVLLMPAIHRLMVSISILIVCLLLTLLAIYQREFDDIHQTQITQYNVHVR
jgi:hypothetical protein